jgi:cytochrome c biogenesis protein CcdA
MKDRSNTSHVDEKPASLKSGGGSFSQILQEIVRHVTEIIHSEGQLLRAEVREDVTQIAKAGVFFVIGAVFAFQALGFVLLGLVYALGSRTPLWLAAVIVGVGAAVIAAVFLRIGRTKIKQASLKPDTTIRSLQENVRWMKKQTNKTTHRYRKGGAWPKPR